MKLRTHAQTAGVSLTAQQPYNNVVRVALQAMAAVLGGTQSLHTNSLDETYALPTEEAVTLALRTQQILAHESGVDRVVDPLAGSYHVEYLTGEMERRAGEHLARIDRMGGMLRAVEQGYPQREIAESAFRHQREVETGERIVRTFLGVWDRPELQPTLLGVLRSAATDDMAAELLAGVMVEGPFQGAAALVRTPDARLRALLVGSQLIGLAMARYVLRIEPAVSMPPDEMAGLIGPGLTRYLLGDLS